MPWTSVAHLTAGAGDRLSHGQPNWRVSKIIDHRGQAPLSVPYPLAHVGLSRAISLMGDSAQSLKADEASLAMWKAAGPDLPITAVLTPKRIFDPNAPHHASGRKVFGQ